MRLKLNFISNINVLCVYCLRAADVSSDGGFFSSNWTFSKSNFNFSFKDPHSPLTMCDLFFWLVWQSIIITEQIAELVFGVNLGKEYLLVILGKLFFQEPAN